MDDQPPADDPALADLTRGMARGDDDAWRRFHLRYGPGLFRHLLACTRGNHALASDSLQGAYLRIGRHVRETTDEARWTAWLRLVARSAWRDLQRRDGRFLATLRRWWGARIEPQDADDQRQDVMLFEALDLCRSRLEPAMRDLLDAKYLEGASVGEIAVRLGASTKAVESRLTRARAELRHLLEEELKRHE